MKKIGVIADTHMPPVYEQINREIEDIFCNVDMILHAGDLTSIAVLDWLDTIAPVICSEGNNDTRLKLDGRVEKHQRLVVEGVEICMTHIVDPLHWPLQKLSEAFKFGDLPDVLVFGDSHETVCEEKEGVLMLNPGSPTSRNMRIDIPGSVAVLTIDEDDMWADIIYTRSTVKDCMSTAKAYFDCLQD